MNEHDLKWYSLPSWQCKLICEKKEVLKKRGGSNVLHLDLFSIRNFLIFNPSKVFILLTLLQFIYFDEIFVSIKLKFVYVWTAYLTSVLSTIIVDIKFVYQQIFFRISKLKTRLWIDRSLKIS